MKLSRNPNFLRHKMQIEEALMTVSEGAKGPGERVYKEMLINAELLDTAMDPVNGEKPTPQSISVKRDAFHKSCKEMGEWLTANAPSVILTWN